MSDITFPSLPSGGSYDCFTANHSTTFSLDNEKWRSVQHYFQAQKFKGNKKAYDAVRDAQTPDDAFKESRKHGIQNFKLWHTKLKYEAMKKGCREKFRHDLFCYGILMKTGSQKLVQTGNKPPWTIDGTHGENWMGQILMELRSEFQQTPPFPFMKFKMNATGDAKPQVGSFGSPLMKPMTQKQVLPQKFVPPKSGPRKYLRRVRGRVRARGRGRGRERGRGRGRRFRLPPKMRKTMVGTKSNSLPMGMKFPAIITRNKPQRNCVVCSRPKHHVPDKFNENLEKVSSLSVVNRMDVENNNLQQAFDVVQQARSGCQQYGKNRTGNTCVRCIGVDVKCNFQNTKQTCDPRSTGCELCYYLEHGLSHRTPFGRFMSTYIGPVSLTNIAAYTKLFSKCMLVCQVVLGKAEVIRNVNPPFAPNFNGDSVVITSKVFDRTLAFVHDSMLPMSVLFVEKMNMQEVNQGVVSNQQVFSKVVEEEEEEKSEESDEEKEDTNQKIAKKIMPNQPKFGHRVFPLQQPQQQPQPRPGPQIMPNQMRNPQMHQTQYQAPVFVPSRMTQSIYPVPPQQQQYQQPYYPQYQYQPQQPQFNNNMQFQNQWNVPSNTSDSFMSNDSNMWWNPERMRSRDDDDGYGESNSFHLSEPEQENDVSQNLVKANPYQLKMPSPLPDSKKDDPDLIFGSQNQDFF